jgi:hypothetical protein
MAKNRVVESCLLATGVLLIAACAAQPVSTSSSEATPSEKRFQRVAATYGKYQLDGQTVYCKKEKGITSSIPVMRCLTETALRQDVADYQKRRNAVARPVMPGTGQGGIGG